jgi:hypothetical protein
MQSYSFINNAINTTLHKTMPKFTSQKHFQLLNLLKERQLVGMCIHLGKDRDVVLQKQEYMFAETENIIL